MIINSSVRILFQLATKVKWISETSNLARRNSNILKQIYYDDDFFNKTDFSVSISGICQDHLIVHCCSFLDEYEEQFTPTKYPERREDILRVKRIVLPAYRRIKYWKDLKSVRNQIIAHNHRIKGRSIFDFDDRINYVVPSTNEEYTLLADLIFLIAQNISQIFPDIVAEIDFSKTLRDCLNFNSKKINSIEDYELIEKEIENNKIMAI